MQTLSVKRSLKERDGFFARQWGPHRTPKQLTFDIIVGIVGPIICFISDPIVLRGGFGGPALFPQFQLLTYLISGLEIVLLLVWLTLGEHLKGLSAPIGGALISGSIFSALIGFAILPYSLIGILILVGFAGFTPFLTSFVYLRNGVCALRSQEQNSTYQVRFPIAVVAAIVTFCLPYAGAAQLNNIFSSAVSNLLNGDEAQVAQAMKILRPWARFSEGQLETIIRAIETSNNDPLRQELLQKRYREITGRQAPSTFAD